MINLPANVLELLEKTADNGEDFTSLFKGLSIGASGRIVMASADMVPLHSALLMHIVANLVEAQTKIAQLEGQLAILKVDLKEGRSYADG